MVKIEFLEVTIQNCALIAHPDRKGLKFVFAPGLEIVAT